jgi:hypothetical protein
VADQASPEFRGGRFEDAAFHVIALLGLSHGNAKREATQLPVGTHAVISFEQCLCWFALHCDVNTPRHVITEKHLEKHLMILTKYAFFAVVGISLVLLMRFAVGRSRIRLHSALR